MNFLVTPFSQPGKVALFLPRVESIWRTQTNQFDAHAVIEREIISVLSTENGHFLLVLHGDELVTISDVCRLENCEFRGIYDRDLVPEAIRNHLAQPQQNSGIKSVFC